jgi:DMSO/TMAO reductase YedYZ molybdopterin-dependent catalytic subunit
MPVDRRTFMKLAAAGLSSAAVHLTACVEGGPLTRASRHRPTPSNPLTRTDDWYFVALTGAYQADLRSHRLHVGGRTRHTLALTTAQLAERFEEVTVPHTLACVGNVPNGHLMSASNFRGVRSRDVLLAAGIRANASGALIYGLDGYLAPRALEDLMRPDTILAYEMGLTEETLEPLNIDHGFPLRILTPGIYGFVQPKWISSITLVDDSDHIDVLRRSNGYASGEMQLASGVSIPAEGQVLAPGYQEILGYAFGDGRVIDTVELNFGDGWSPAEILWNTPEDDLPPGVWALWRYRWDAVPGDLSIAVRARYEDGETQRGGRDFPYSGGSLTILNISVRDS